jgi:hypothetical protein
LENNPWFIIKWLIVSFILSFHGSTNKILTIWSKLFWFFTFYGVFFFESTNNFWLTINFCIYLYKLAKEPMASTESILILIMSNIVQLANIFVLYVLFIFHDFYCLINFILIWEKNINIMWIFLYNWIIWLVQHICCSWEVLIFIFLIRAQLKL